jgi:hypothetical protein
MISAPLSSAQVGQVPLPDNRAYEQVSPVDKAGNDVAQFGAMAATDGGGLLFMSFGPFAGAQSALGADGLFYLANRGAGNWSTTSIMPPGGLLTVAENGYMGFLPDLSKGIIRWREDQLNGTVDPNAPITSEPFSNSLYMRDSGSGAFQLLNGTLASLGPGPSAAGFVWGSSDFTHLAISSGNGLTADSPCDGTGGDLELCAYESVDGSPRIASVLPDGTPVQGAVGARVFQGNFEHAMSDDGARLFFTSPPENGSAVGKLYARENGTSTTLVSASERTLPGGVTGQNIDYQSAEAAHGDKVLFATEDTLVDADTNAARDLYLYDFGKPAGERLTLVSEDTNPAAPDGAEIERGYPRANGGNGGLMGASEDLHRVYFVAKNQIVAGEPEGPGPKLYLWEDTGGSSEVTFIGALKRPGEVEGLGLGEERSEYGDLFDWTAGSVVPREGMRQARFSADGRYLVFPSFAQLTDFDTGGRNEIYRYDAVTKRLDCASCSADAFPAGGTVELSSYGYITAPVNHLLNNVSASGQVFFQTTRGLVPRDSNGKMDVYEYDGALHLISQGTGDADSAFLDATPSGSDVFFATRDRLVGWDEDPNYDVYDARVGGGLPEPPPGPPPCEGDSCQPAPVAPNDPTPASSTFNGAGNVRTASARCGAGKVRTKGKCRKKNHAKRHAKTQHKATRPTTRSHG